VRDRRIHLGSLGEKPRGCADSALRCTVGIGRRLVGRGFDLSGLKGHNTGVSCAWERGSDHSPRESTPSMEARSVIAGNLRKIGV
jgi:hypothetical protein